MTAFMSMKILLGMACLFAFSLVYVNADSGVLGCRTSVDKVFKGNFVDCSSRKLSHTDLAKINFDGTSSLNISGNPIRSIPNNTFSKFKDLKRLICSQCELSKLYVDSLRGLDALEVLYLDRNSLVYKDKSFPMGFFSRVSGLRRLYIEKNNKHEKISETEHYSNFTDLFDTLPKLHHLTIDSFDKLKIGQEFTRLTTLHSLEIDGGLDTLNEITNNSFLGFRNSSVRELVLTGGRIESDLGIGAFEHLPNISYLSLDSVRIGNLKALQMMEPFRGRKMDTIQLKTVYSPLFSSLDHKINDGIIRADSTKFVKDICLANFFWFDSHTFAIDGDAFFSETWETCIKGMLVQSDQMVEADVSSFFKIALAKNVEFLAYLTLDDGFLNQFPIYDNNGDQTSSTEKDDLKFQTRSVYYPLKVMQGYTYLETSHPSIRDKSRVFGTPEVSNGPNSYNYTQARHLFFQDHKNRIRREVESTHNNTGTNLDLLSKQSESSHNSPILFKHGDVQLYLDSFSKTSLVPCSLHSDPRRDDCGILAMYPPPALRTFVIDGLHYIQMLIDVEFKTNSVTTVVGSNSKYPLRFNNKKIYGLDKLITFNAKNSELYFDFDNLDFFETFPVLKNLILSNTMSDPNFLEKNCKRLVENLKYLEYLDISHNGLLKLFPRTFSRNKHLKHLNLEGNRLSSIPFLLADTPQLEVLNLRENAFVDLPADDRDSITRHITNVENFKILFDDNQLSCTCSDLPFIVWLVNHRHHFDLAGNFTCMTQSGALSNTASFQDLDAFWRMCHSKTYFLSSLILACAIVAGYLAIFMCMKNKTQIVSNLMQVFVPRFRLKTRRDYSTDVFIGYAHHEATYVRNVLLPVIEGKWRLKTFVHSRDLRMDPLDMTTSLQDSWRCLLVVTENFLDHFEFSHNIMKVASYFVGPSNPRCIVVLVEQTVQHRLPAYLLQVVDDDNILIIPRLGQGASLDYEINDTLRTRLLLES